MIYQPESSDRPVHPYNRLSPDCVLDALASVGLYGDGRLQSLASYENRVYQVWLEDGSKRVAKFYRPGRWTAAQIQEEHDFANQLASEEIPMVAPWEHNGRSLLEHDGFAFSVSPWCGGRQPEFDDWEVLEWVGRLLARLHNVGARQPFRHRMVLNVAERAAASRQWLLDNDCLPPAVRGTWAQASEQVCRHLAGLQPNYQAIRVHGDCHPGNILWTPESDSAPGGPHFVDLDDACMGPAIQDLWMLLSGDRRQRSQQLSTLVEGYEQLRPLDRRELTWIEPLRSCRLLHYSAWLAQRWEDPAFPGSFPWFGSEDYWQEQARLLQSQLLVMQEEPLWV